MLNAYDEESDHSNKAVRKTPEIESGHKVSEEVKWTWSDVYLSLTM